MKRRDMLLGTLGISAALALPEYLRAAMASPLDSASSLKALAAKSGLKLGIQASKANLQIPEFVQFVTENFSMLTPGLEFLWPRLQPKTGAYNFDEADWMVNFCQTHGLAAHGHSLCTNGPGGNPSWLSSVLTHGNAKNFLTDYVTTVVKRYRGRVASWDVVNEPIVAWSKRPDGLYPGVWLNMIGNDYIDVAFFAAKAADPDALRVLNCYGVEEDKPDFEKARELTLALLQQLLKRGVPIQAVGLESHLDATARPGGAAYISFLEKVRSMGLQTLITELDVDDSQVPGDKQRRDDIVAQRYYDYLLEAVPAGKMNRVIFWTPSDRWNWMNSSNLPPRFRRVDGQPHRPGLMDDALQKKPAFDAVCAALRRLSGATGSAGIWTARS